jgi:hypothetical protein
MKATTFGSTLLIIDREWNDNTGTHLNRPAIFIADNGDGTIKVMRASTKRAKRGLPPRAEDRRVMADGAGFGNSFNEVCDLKGGSCGIIEALPTHLVIRQLGDLSKADAWWVEDQVFA